MKKTLSIVLLCTTLGGCITDGSTTSLAPVCDALIGPLKYSSTNKNSTRYAAKDLAPDLALRNRVGVNLGCPQYLHAAVTPTPIAPMPVKAAPARSEGESAVALPEPKPTLMQRFQRVWQK